MVRALKTCSTPGCPELVASGRCEGCAKRADLARGTAAQRGYGGKLWRSRRRACLRRDPICTCTDQGHMHPGRCWQQSTVADHYPTSRRDLVAQGVHDPDALDLLRGMCKACHDRATAVAQPGGYRLANGG